MNHSDFNILRNRLEEYASADEQLFQSLREHENDLVQKLSFVNRVGEVRSAKLLDHLLDVHADQKTIIASLLLSYEEQPQWDQWFGKDVVALVDGASHLLDLSFESLEFDEQKGEVLRKMLVGLSKDIRVVLLYMVFQLCRLESDDAMDIANLIHRRRLALVMLHIFVPVAGRLGMYRLKRKLEDACFKFLYPSEFFALKKEYEQKSELTDETILSIADFLVSFFRSKRIIVSVSGRVKGMYSTFSKMQKNEKLLIDDVSDLLALRVLVDNVVDCYTAMGYINSQFITRGSRLKDYIAYPKVNGYRSLHMVVLGLVFGSPQIPVEVQIRTHAMHKEAEYGVAAHWWYDEQGVEDRSYLPSPETSQMLMGEQMKWVENLVRIHRSLSEKERVNSMDLFSDRIFVLTITNQVVDLPKGSTPVDFAYAISEEMGNKLFKVKVNGRMVSLDYELESGDKVFLIQKMCARPSVFWLSFVKTPKARLLIQTWLREQSDGFSVQDKKKASLREISSLEEVPVTQELPAGSSLEVHGYSDLATRLASCCTPPVGSSVLGYVTRGGIISVHRKNCSALQALDRRRYIEVGWKRESAKYHGRA